MLRVSYVGASKQQKWVWGSGDERNALQDAEQLLVLLHPVNELDAFSLHSPDRIKPGSDLYRVLEPVFRSISRVPTAVVDICLDYFTRHVDDNGEPTFTGGSYLSAYDTKGAEPTAKQR